MPSVSASESPTRRTRTGVREYECGMVAVIGVAGSSLKALAAPVSPSVHGEAATTIDVEARATSTNTDAPTRPRIDTHYVPPSPLR